MKHLSLAARYRPQTFAEVAGQEMVVAALSRAAERDSPAPAYLLSGTRGVGKTTIARIFAKALNCEHAPAAEPCNECAQCRKIAAGSHVDVTEIDGASNNSVEDARALREHIGYAPMDGRYKVFIIDEAHMLSRSAFNALLKTLEEPPERVVFIFATTEAHKFPVTIVSRCQHFVFRHLGEDALAAHLVRTLNAEGRGYEDAAVRLIARRAAGSVRDAMSLLDQTLALGGATLDAETTRQVLGLAGQELFTRLFGALSAQDCAAAADTSRHLLREGVDIGFFLRELAGHWRNLFLFRQGGGAALGALALPEDEAAWLTAMAERFSAPHLHAAWQMTLDAQRGITQSPEPGAALELLLLNLALLPRLLPLEKLEGLAGATAEPARPVAPPESRPRVEPARPGPAQAPAPEARAPNATEAPAPVPEAEPRSAAPEHAEAAAHIEPPRETAEKPAPAAAASSGAPEADTAAPGNAPEPVQAAPNFQPDWASFCAFCTAEHEAGRPAPPLHALRGLEVDWRPGALTLHAPARALVHQLEKHRPALEAALASYCGGGAPELDIVAPRARRSQGELIAEFSRRPELRHCFELLGAEIDHCTEAGAPAAPLSAKP
ncbi:MULTISPECIES: DNA polymerase III subunit gamma/tau [unclassified Desulfovibrio]|uniref:DNA polymerase III subunit gamma/tau n=1 Tax=unclassified Desulfovibrio TaxID=2593640 RepID=UPI0013EA719E|nr:MULTISPECIES: DNA polymerase III subunit gamma/tau [unclassified Desulfovibrio]